MNDPMNQSTTVLEQKIIELEKELSGLKEKAGHFTPGAGLPAHSEEGDLFNPQKHTQDLTGNQAAYLAALQEISVGLISNLDLDASLQSILHSAISLARVPNGYISMIDFQTNELVIRHGYGFFKEKTGQRVKLGDAVLFNRISKTTRPEVILNPGQSQKPFPKDWGWVKSIAVFPLLLHNQQVVGEIGLAYHESGYELDETQVDTINRLAQIASVVIENVRLHTSLRHEENKLRHMIEKASEGIILLDTDGKVLDWNDAQERITGVSHHDALASNFFAIMVDVLPQKSYRQTVGTLSKIFHSVRSRSLSKIMELNLPQSNGHERTIQLSFLRFESEKGPLVGIISRDITEQHLMERKLVESQKLAGIGTLAAGIAHEINTPLQVITGTSEILIRNIRENAINPETMIRKLDMINRTSWQIADIVRALQDYARTAPENMEAEDINGLIQDTLVLVENQFKTKHNVLIITDLDPERPEVVCERNKIIQMLINLLNNARDAMPEGGQICILTRSNLQQGKCIIKVQDTGSGILPDTIEKIFDPFFTTKPFGKGTGLGLSIVGGIIRSHQGTIDVQSKPGQGATFSVSLPRQGPSALSSVQTGQKKKTGRFDD